MMKVFNWFYIFPLEKIYLFEIVIFHNYVGLLEGIVYIYIYTVIYIIYRYMYTRPMDLDT